MTSTHTVVLATSNKGKLREFAELLSGVGFKVRAQSEFGMLEAAETAPTFVENALIKARHAARLTGLPALADDSGLEVDFLHGAPGVWSARYAGQGAGDRENLDKLLAALSGVPPEKRRARFVCLIVYLRHADDPTPVISQGVWEGTILAEPRGVNGFGYDPVFQVPELDMTAAELAAEVKNRLSHRGKALHGLLTRLRGEG